MHSLLVSAATLLSLTGSVLGLGCQDKGSNTTCFHEDVMMMLQTTSVTHEARERAFIATEQTIPEASCVSSKDDLPLQQHWYLDHKNKKDKKGFKYKTMRYCNSCFPCSIQMALTNMGIDGLSNELEEKWNQLQIADEKPNLDKAPPDEEAIHKLIQASSMFFSTDLARMKIISPSSFTGEGREAFKTQFPEDLKYYDAFIIGHGHARLVFRNKDGSATFVDPEPMHAHTAKINNEVLYDDDIRADLSGLDDAENPEVSICGKTGWFGGFGCTGGHYILMLKADPPDVGKRQKNKKGP